MATWVGKQRNDKKKGKVDAERGQRLNSLGFVFDPYGATWEEMFGRLVAFKAEHGHCNVPRTYQDTQLAAWVEVQRRVFKKGSLDPEREQRMEALGFVWDPRAAQWEEMFGRLEAFKAEHGHCMVPADCQDQKLFNWVGTQRAWRKTGKLAIDRERKLEELGFEWSPR